MPFNISTPGLLFFTLLILASCQDKESPLFSTDINSVKNQQDLRAVEDKIDAYLLAHPSDSGCLWYGQLGEVALKISRTMDSERYYLKALRDYPECPNTPSNLMALANIYQNYFQWEFTGEAICCAIKERSDEKLINEATRCCPVEIEPIDTLLVRLRSKVYDAAQNSLDNKAARNYIALCQIRALLNPENEFSADHLNEAAKVAKAIQAPLQAIELYDWIQTDYAQTLYGPKAIFLKAFTYENDLGDLEKARENYELFLKNYPNDEFADDAKLLLENLGKDPEELIQKFEKSLGQ